MKVSIIIPISENDLNQKEKIEKMLMYQTKKPDEIIFVSEGTIPQARNIGTKKARNEYILHCDAGTIYPNNYVEEMCKGFEKNEFISARFFLYGDKYQNFFIRNNFGSTRCLGFTKRIYEIVGGFKENLHWGEDTDFIINVRKITPLHISDAICFWKARSSLKKLKKQFNNYGKGDKWAKNVKRIAYFFPLLFLLEWMFHSFHLLKYIWTFRINYWRGII